MSNSTTGFCLQLPVVDLAPEGETDLWAIVWTSNIAGGKVRLHCRRYNRRGDGTETKEHDCTREEAKAILAGVKGEFHFTGWV